MTTAVDGTNFGQAGSFAFAFNGSAGASVAKALVVGSYYLLASADVIVTYGVTAGSPAAAALPATQPAAGSPNRSFVVPANVPFAFDLDLASASIAALGYTAAGGTLAVVGPIGRSVNNTGG